MLTACPSSSDAKVEYLRSLGCDVPFNYKKKAYKEVLAEHGPLDVYYVRLIRPKQFLEHRD